MTVQILFGVHYFAAKTVLREIPPEAWAPIRAVAAALFLTGLARVLRRPFPRGVRTLAALAGLSILGVTTNQLMFVKGLALTRTTHSALINSSIPVLTLTLAMSLGRERLVVGRALGILVGLAGVLVLLRPESFAGMVGSTITQGDLLTLTNALSYSLFLVLSRPVLVKLDSLAATAVVFLFGSALLVLIGAPALARLDVSSLSPRTWILGLFVILGPTVGAYALQFFALRRAESSVVALFTYLQFLIGGFIGILFLREPAEPRLGLAAVLVLGGLVLGSRSRRHAEAG